MASPTQWIWVWVNSGSWRWIGRPDVLLSMGLQRVRHGWVTELNLILEPQFPQVSNGHHNKTNFIELEITFHPEPDHHMWDNTSKVTNSETRTKLCLVQSIIDLKCWKNASPVQKVSWFVSPWSYPPLRCFEKWYYGSKIRWLSLASFRESRPRNYPLVFLLVRNKFMENWSLILIWLRHLTNIIISFHRHWSLRDLSHWRMEKPVGTSFRPRVTWTDLSGSFT